ncbi:SRPBCC family protein [Parafrankia sp. EUN1f]|uniref:SRPBCC family protein n=1 Tax=Parafrankia sp. EUN1f TaxID=102897 RepID=UPI0001C473EC|nr:SRPBCC family protein [Parafrankia sp. EUN1f]EFC86771.1 hypothetical protein FrEUN1fDRAFT_0022 [Parafrankia sp. EUN1f]
MDQPNPFDEQQGRPRALTSFTTTGILAAPIERVWQLVRDFAGIMAWHPSVTSCKVQGSGVGALRVVQLGDREVVERLDELDDARHAVQYSVVVGRPQTIGLTGRIQLDRTADGETAVSWLTTVPDLPGAAELVDGFRTYYAGRVENLRDAVSGSAS